MSVHLDPAVRHEAVIMFDAIDSNPNGDPDAANQPRTDDEDGHGIVTDVSLKRKIRDTVAEIHGADPRNQIFVEAGHALAPRTEEGFRATGASEADAVRWLCDRYFDVRMFGAVLTRGKGGGAAGVRGPVQIGFGRTLDPVYLTDRTITRVTRVTQEEIDKGPGVIVGSKWTVAYGLYRAHLYYSPGLAAKAGVTADDLGTLWASITQMFDVTRSASRVGVDLAGLWVFSHPTAVGVAPARALLDRVHVQAIDPGTPPRRLTDYRRELRLAGIPDGVTLTSVYDTWSSYE